MKVQAINNNYNNPNFGALRISHSPEMKATIKVFKKNSPEFYNTLVNDCGKFLNNTKIFDGILDVEHGQFVMRLQHTKDFNWLGKRDLSSIIFNKKNYYPKLYGSVNEIEFNASDKEWLRFKKFDENDKRVRYTVKYTNSYGRWSDKNVVKIAELIKKLDDNMKKVFIG